MDTENINAQEAAPSTPIAGAKDAVEKSTPRTPTPLEAVEGFLSPERAVRLGGGTKETTTTRLFVARETQLEGIISPGKLVRTTTSLVNQILGARTLLEGRPKERVGFNNVGTEDLFRRHTKALTENIELPSKIQNNNELWSGRQEQLRNHVEDEEGS